MSMGFLEMIGFIVVVAFVLTILYGLLHVAWDSFTNRVSIIKSNELDKMRSILGNEIKESAVRYKDYPDVEKIVELIGWHISRRGQYYPHEVMNDFFRHKDATAPPKKDLTTFKGVM